MPNFTARSGIAAAIGSLLPGGVGLFAADGARYFVHAASRTGQALAARRNPQHELLALAPAGPLGLVIDVGCNAGAFALPLAGRARKIVCIDADHDQIWLLRRTLRLNRIANAEALWAAIATEGDQVDFHVAARLKNLSSRDAARLRGRDRFVTRAVPGVPLGRIIDNHGPVDLLKIDITGFSGSAIASLGEQLGAVNTIIAGPGPDMGPAVALLQAAGFALAQPLAERSDLPDSQRFAWLATRDQARNARPRDFLAANDGDGAAMASVVN